MNIDEELYCPIQNNGIGFIKGSVKSLFQNLISQYNQFFNEEETNIDNIKDVIEEIISWSIGRLCFNEFAQIMVILLLTIEKKSNSRVVWLYSSEIAFNYGDLEICRELAIFAIDKAGIGTVKNSNKEFIKLSKEDKEENVADILEMIVEELGRESYIEEEKYNKLLIDFAKPLAQWRNLEVPKSKQEGSYDLVYQIVELCYIYKAYHTAIRLSGLLYISDQTKNKENLSNTIFLMGKIVYELGYLEVAKQCFLFVDKDTKGKCWKEKDEKYNILLQQETKLELTNEILEKDKELKEKISSGEIKLYTYNELKKYYAKELDIPFIDLKKQKKARMKIGEKAMKKYEKYAQGSMEEQTKGIEEAFSVFTENPEVYEEAAYLYYLKANLFLSQDDFKTAYEYFQKAYRCEKGKRNGLVLLGTAVALSQMGRMKEAIVYLFRTYILCGKDFITEKVGEKTWNMVEKYL